MRSVLSEGSSWLLTIHQVDLAAASNKCVRGQSIFTEKLASFSQHSGKYLTTSCVLLAFAISSTHLPPSRDGTTSFLLKHTRSKVHR